MERKLVNPSTSEPDKEIGARDLLFLGHKTIWGEIAAVVTTGGERYYWMVKPGSVAMMPASVVEQMERNKAKGPGSVNIGQVRIGRA